jgi:CRISPR/Cas system-associated exonuclease Cas4 (RecB family)
MVHKIELQVVEFMRSVAKAPLEMEEKLLQPAAKDVGHFLSKLYENDPNKPFTLRMSNIGRPLCQLQMAKKNSTKAESDWFLPLRLMLGGVTEGLTMSILRHAGVNVQEAQTKVKLPIEYTHNSVTPFGTTREVVEVSGSLDVIIDDAVWDIKSASPYSYAEKFSSYESLKASDDFGYRMQLYGYAKARGCAAGGFIVIDKSSGEIKVIEVPHNWEQEQAEILEETAHKFTALLSDDMPFQRSFSDQAEKFKKQLTGNRILSAPCTFCEYKRSCWPSLRHLPVEQSTAYERPYKWYTKHETAL